MQVTYRIKQLKNSLFGTLSKNDLTLVQEFLPPALFDLFSRMQESEQVHSIQVFVGLQSQGETNNDLLTAALLHDVGKIYYPLSVIDRIIIVVVNTIHPNLLRRWGEGEARGYRRPFVVACQHPTWGAQLVRAAGGSEMTARLIQRHQDPTQVLDPGKFNNEEDQLLLLLQKLDNAA